MTVSLVIGVHVSSPSAMSDHFNLPCAVAFAVTDVVADTECAYAPFAVIDEVDVDVAPPKIITCDALVTDELVLDVALPKASRCPTLVVELATVDVAAPRLTFSPTEVVVTVELDVAAPATVVKLSVTTTVVLAANAPEVSILTALTLATPDVTDTKDAPSSKSAVEYLPLLYLY